MGVIGPEPAVEPHDVHLVTGRRPAPERAAQQRVGTQPASAASAALACSYTPSSRAPVSASCTPITPPT